MSEEEQFLIERCGEGDERALRYLIGRYEKRVYPLAVWLLGGDRDKGYEAASSSLAAILGNAGKPGVRKELFIRILQQVVRHCQSLKGTPSDTAELFPDYPPEKIRMTEKLQEAMQHLPYESKALLLLRDQSCLSYREISVIMQVSPREARLKTIASRSRLRERLEEALRRGI